MVMFIYILGIMGLFKVVMLIHKNLIWIVDVVQ